MRDFLLFCFFLARLLMYVGAHVNVGMANSFIYKIGKYKEKRAKDVDTSRIGRTERVAKTVEGRFSKILSCP